MATCKDCICYSGCSGILNDFGMRLNPAREVCDRFEDRARFVELPCNVGDRLYVLFPKGRAIVEYVVIAFWIEETGTIIRVVDTRFFTTTIFFIKDIGTKAFLTKKEAEQALKEREKR